MDTTLHRAKLQGSTRRVQKTLCIIQTSGASQQFALIHEYIQVSSGAGLNPFRGTDRHSPQWDSTWEGRRQSRG